MNNENESLLKWVDECFEYYKANYIIESLFEERVIEEAIKAIANEVMKYGVTSKEGSEIIFKMNNKKKIHINDICKFYDRKTELKNIVNEIEERNKKLKTKNYLYYVKILSMMKIFKS